MSSGWAICLIANCAMAGKTDKIWFQPPDLPVGADLKALLETGGSIIAKGPMGAITKDRTAI
jgi:hypothetical protein